MDDIQKQREHFEGVSSNYYAARQHKNHLTLKHLLWSDFFHRNSKRLQGKAKVLEPMCGYSEGRSIITTHLSKEISYTGFDFSRPLVDQGIARNPGDKIFVQDITRWEPEEDYDLIILIGGLHHVYRHTRSVLEKLSAALRPDGYLINFEPTQNNPIFRYIRSRIYERNALFDADTERAYELQEINALYRSAGLEIQDQLYPGLLAYIMYYNPDAFPKLNLGNASTVRLIFALEKHAYRSRIARILSFATLTLLAKQAA